MDLIVSVPANQVNFVKKLLRKLNLPAPPTSQPRLPPRPASTRPSSIESKQKGQRGGARVITCIKIVGQTIYLLTIYDKAEQDTISDEERDELLRESGLL